MRLFNQSPFAKLFSTSFPKCFNIKIFSILFVFLATSCALDRNEQYGTMQPDDSILLSQGVEDEATVDAQGQQAQDDLITEDILALLEVRTFYFDFDSSSLKQAAIDSLDVHAQAIKAVLQSGENLSIVLEGYTDERGTREYNLALGERRAESVGRYLRVNGIPANVIDTISYGEERPVALGSNEAAWQKNRRVQIKY